MAQVTWTNVGGDAVNNAAQQSAAQTQQGADLIQSGLNTLIGMSKDKTERNLTVYNNIAERNLQKELNAISGITDADEILEFQVDQDALREDYGFQLGGLGKSEESVELLREAADQRFNELVKREEVIDIRNSRLDDKANEEIFAEYRALPSNQNKTLQELKDGWEDHIAGLDSDRRRGKDIIYWGKGRIQEMSKLEEGLTTGKININSQNKADYLASYNIYNSKAAAESGIYSTTYGNGASHKQLSGTQIEDHLRKVIQDNGLVEKGIFNSDVQALEQLKGLTDATMEVFYDDAEKLRKSAMASLQFDQIDVWKEKRDLAEPGTAAWNEADAQMKHYENILEGFKNNKDSRLVITQELLNEVITASNVLTGDSFFGSSTDPQKFKSNIKKQWNANRYKYINRISKIYQNQVGSRTTALSIQNNLQLAARNKYLADRIVKEATDR